MKTKLATFLTLASLSAFAGDLLMPAPTAAAAAVGSKVLDPKEGYLYVRFLTSDTDMTHTNAVTPGLGFGYRRLTGDGALDISMSGNGSDRFRKAFWTLPKASYLRYFTPDKEESFYGGGGMAWGGVHNRKGNEFVGLIPSATVGYEFLHKSTALGFTELTVSMPAVPVYKEGKTMGPIAEISVGAGF